jgi:DNA-binding CsgD family transcriptional regulator
VENRPIYATAQQRQAAPLTTVGIAIDAPALRRSVSDLLAESNRYEAFPFDPDDVVKGTWPHRPCAVVVATPGPLQMRRSHHDGDHHLLGYRVVLVIGADDLSRERTALASCDSFVVAERIAALLPSIIVLSAHRLSVMPDERTGGPLKVDRRLLMLPRLSKRDRAVLAELAVGSDNGAIAGRLDISEAMAKVCVRRVITLFGFRNRTDAAVFAAALDLGGASRPHTSFANGPTKKG